jgi:hypothetical protein
VGHAQRIQVAAILEFAVVLLALVYATAGQQVLSFAQSQPDGPFSDVLGQLSALMPPLIGLLLLAPLVWLLIAPYQQERARDVRRRR